MKRREELDKYHDLSEVELLAETARLKESLFRACGSSSRLGR